MSGYIEIQQVGNLLDTGVLRLNKLAERCGIGPSIGGGGQKGSRRHFSLRDVCSLGLAAWLSNAGLRAPAMKDILKRRVTKSLLTGLTTLKQVEAEAKRRRSLVAVGFRGTKPGFRNVALVRSQHAVGQKLKNESGVSVPIGRFLEDLAVRLRGFAST